ncbi:hypothetical protein BZG36_01009 [Bifiguratus adelaidae]|uniref:Anoctamin dimerisation domain-containing protein n=1 Tax=Bifiguratus adelaidae TaxID=1938954 RepID=A0A261Y6I6_9FUNG|nr:hypothetical protein BZG36_01009 [Bifiguratus adelaidae]
MNTERMQPAAESAANHVDNMLPLPKDKTASEHRIQADYVILFKFAPKPVASESREKYQQRVATAFENLCQSLDRVGLQVEVRPGNDNGELLIFVLCPWNILQKELAKARVDDWLAGVRSGDPDSSDSAATQTEIPEAERLRLVYNLLTLPTVDGGSNIIPGETPFVDGLFCLHDTEFNDHWVKAWATKYLIDDKDLLMIRNHFGEKIAFYFAYLQFYFLYLTIPAAVGVLIWILNLPTFTVSWSLFMVTWSIFYTEMWKRRQFELAVWWGTRNCSRTDKRRAAFEYEEVKKDPVTGESVPYFPVWKKWARRAVSIPVIAISAISLSVAIACVFMSEVFLKEYYRGPFAQYLVFLPTILYAAAVPQFSAAYVRMAKSLNKYENHPTDSKYEYHFVQKIFVANFLVSYMALLLIEWVYIPFQDWITPQVQRLSVQVKHDGVGPERLKAQFIALILTGQIINFFLEMVLPPVMRLVMSKVKQYTGKNGKETDVRRPVARDSPAEKDFLESARSQAALEDYNIYTDYVEMVIQFGHVSCFSTVWPLAPLCAFINDWIELRGDAVKICRYTRRPVPERAEDIGPWMENITALTWLASLTTSSYAYLFHPSTDIHSPYTPALTLCSVLLAEHVYFLLRAVIGTVVRSFPSWAQDMVKRDEYGLKQKWLQRLGGKDGLIKREVNAQEAAETEKARFNGESNAFWRGSIQEKVQKGMELLNSELKSQ